MNIPEALYKNNSVHRSLGNDPAQSILSCGFLHHKTHDRGNENLCFQYYGALLLISGEGVYTDGCGNEAPLFPGCFVQRIPGRLHSTIVKEDGRWLEFFLCFGYDTYVALHKCGILSDEPVLNPGISEVLLNECLSFHSALRKAGEDELPLLLLEAQRIVFSIYRAHERHAADEPMNLLLKQSLKLLGNGVSGTKSATETAEYLGIGYENFRKLFKKSNGISPHAYIIQKRIDQSKDLLLQNDLSVKEIAISLGFPDACSFSRQFRKVTSLTPTQFRALHFT